MTDLFLDPTIISIVLGSVMPILVGVVTKQVASNALKATALAFLSGVTGILAGAQTAGGIVSRETLMLAAVAWVVGVATHFGYYKPTGVSDKVQEKTSNFGVGG